MVKVVLGGKSELAKDASLGPDPSCAGNVRQELYKYALAPIAVYSSHAVLSFQGASKRDLPNRASSCLFRPCKRLPDLVATSSVVRI